MKLKRKDIELDDNDVVITAEHIDARNITVYLNGILLNDVKLIVRIGKNVQ
jgi:hypothetical protein